MRKLAPLCAFLGVAACSAAGNPSGGDDTPPGDDDDVTPPDDPPPPPKRVKFIAMGDTGKGNTSQRQVAVAIRDLCAARGCDFVLLLGDNIYDAGVDSVTDSQWQTKFEEPYHDIDLPFYVALGNHDNGGRLIIDAPGIGNEFDKGQIEVDYTAVSTKWTMPSSHYTFSFAHVGIVVLDTNALLWENVDYGDQTQWMPQAMMEVSGKDWVLFAGHHPYRSNGSHGNAGDYDAPELAGIPISNPLPIQNGEALKDWFDGHACGLADVYFSGHDHSRQWIDEPTALCGTKMIVSGAGASTTEIRDRGNTALFEDASKAGFMYVDIDGDKFTGEFHDATGALDFTHTFTKQ
ncbi:MAG: metallophosphoesterase [Deltaproteobacteria bacterium]|nr:metallophosphoesterase [Deltaproteobacteria bacterium]